MWKRDLISNGFAMFPAMSHFCCIICYGLSLKKKKKKSVYKVTQWLSRLDCKKKPISVSVYIYIYIYTKKVSKDNVRKKNIYKVLFYDCILRQIHVSAILVR